MLPQRSSSPSPSVSEASNSSLFKWRPSLYKKWSEKSYQLLPTTSLSLKYPRTTHIFSRKRVVLIVLTILAGLFFISRGWNSFVTYSDGVCRLDLLTLKQFGLTQDFSYSRRYIKQVPFEKGSNPNANLSWVDELNENIFTGLDYLSFGSVDQRNGSIVDLKSCSPNYKPMHLRNQLKPINAERFVFGMATTAERLLEYAATISLWIGNTGAQLIVIVPKSSKVEELRIHLSNLGIIASVLISNDEFLFNYFRLVEAFYAHNHDESKWFTFIDDDTHYFSLQRFINDLSVYDSNKEFYIGGVSEDARQLGYEGNFAFGGAGITISKGLLNHLHQVYNQCRTDYEAGLPGDARVKLCIYQHTETKFMNLEGLHQVDLLGQTHGILEGPRPPITWHHFRSWSRQPVDLISKAGQICNGLCLFQRWKFHSNFDYGYSFMTLHFGFSIVGYTAPVDLSKTETTWTVLPDSNFKNSLAPLRSGLQEGIDRFTYRLKGVGKDVDGHVKHTYIKYVDREKLRLIQEEKERLNSTTTINENRKSIVSQIDEVMELVFI